MAIHVLGHLLQLPALALPDWRRSGGREAALAGSGLRMALLAPRSSPASASPWRRSPCRPLARPRWRLSRYGCRGGLATFRSISRISRQAPDLTQEDSPP